MKLLVNVQMPLLPVLICVGFLAWPSDARAQSNVGSGPLTGTLTETEPTSGVISLGPIKLAPGIVVREIGWDSNIYDERVNPKEDYVAAVLPDVALFSRTRFLKVSAYVGGEFVYYQKYESERSNGHSERGRVDFLLSRMRPFVAGGQSISRTRPNGEINTRANLKTNEVSGGFAFDLAAHSVAYVAAYQSATRFRYAFEEGIELGASLNRDGNEYSAGIKTDLTPLAALTLSGSYREDTFKGSPQRNSDSRLATASVKIGTEAVVSGVVTASFRDFKAVDPLIRRYRGVVGSASIVYPFLEVGRVGLLATRALEYSFDEAEAYYLENTVSLSYTHRLFGNVDAQLRGSRSLFDYGFREGAVDRQDTLDLASGGLGYNLRNRTRVSLNYEFSRRRSPALAERNYDRRRLFTSWTYAF